MMNDNEFSVYHSCHMRIIQHASLVHILNLIPLNISFAQLYVLGSDSIRILKTVPIMYCR